MKTIVLFKTNMYSWITDFYSLHSIYFCMCANVKIGAKGRGGGGGRAEEEGREGGKGGIPLLPTPPLFPQFLSLYLVITLTIL